MSNNGGPAFPGFTQGQLEPCLCCGGTGRQQLGFHPAHDGTPLAEADMPCGHCGGNGKVYGSPIHHHGLSMRDWFAGMAMQGLCRDVKWDYSEGHCNAAIAHRSYVIADAMLKEREKDG